jgi:NADH dehydrogenase
MAKPLNTPDLSNLTGEMIYGIEPGNARHGVWIRVSGRNVVRALAKREYRMRVAVRRPELAGHLQPLGRVGQIHAVQANLRYPASVEAAMRDSHAAINLVGILAEGGAQTFDAVQARGAGTVARAAAVVGADMVHISAIGADENSLSSYGRSKAAGEKAVLAAVPSATILRPSVVFGPEDQFTNRLPRSPGFRRRCR